MLVDWLIYGLFVFGVAKLLNATLFKLKPASRPVAWILTILMLVVSLAALSALKVLRYQILSDDIGVPIKPQNPFEWSIAFFSAWLFYSILNVEVKNREQASTVRPPISATPAFSNAHTRDETPTAQHVPQAPTVDRHTAPPTLSSPESTNEIYSLIAEELEAGRPDKGLWTRLFAECGGDEKNTKVLYIKQRAEHLIAAEKSRTMLAAHERAQAAVQAAAVQAQAELKQRETQNALIEQRKAMRPRLLDLCASLRTGSLDYEGYEQLAKVVGVSLRYEGFVFGKYIVTRGDVSTSFGSINDLRPWFLENVVPVIEAEV